MNQTKCVNNSIWSAFTPKPIGSGPNFILDRYLYIFAFIYQLPDTSGLESVGSRATVTGDSARDVIRSDGHTTL